MLEQLKEKFQKSYPNKHLIEKSTGKKAWFRAEFSEHQVEALLKHEDLTDSLRYVIKNLEHKFVKIDGYKITQQNDKFYLNVIGDINE